MDYENPTVEPEETEAVADDAQLEALEEEADTSLPLEDALADEQQEQPKGDSSETQGPSEPGWIKKRVDKAVQKAIAETESRLNSQYKAQMQPILDRLLEQDAQDLVRQGEFKTIERAREYLQLKQGMPVTAPKQQTRNERGQFAGSANAEAKVRADILSKQANKIKTSRGLDVMAEFNGNEETKAKVLSGEWDFYDVAESMSTKPAKAKAPAPMRSPNGASGAERSTIANMSDEQFDRFDHKISEGARYTVK